MRDVKIKSAVIDVQPHQKDGDELKHTNIAVTALYNTIVSVANLKAQVVWQRYNAMLVANSVISYAVNSAAMQTHPSVKACVGRNWLAPMCLMGSPHSGGVACLEHLYHYGSAVSLAQNR